tara:strand:+ start:159 stop:329 length:171 start_codon:yes stop_codon:yes gene_type:complete
MSTTKSKYKKVKAVQDRSLTNTKQQKRSRGNHFTDSFGGVIYYKSKKNDRTPKQHK